jgi:hypothetical protein
LLKAFRPQAVAFRVYRDRAAPFANPNWPHSWRSLWSWQGWPVLALFRNIRAQEGAARDRSRYVAEEGIALTRGA